MQSIDIHIHGGFGINFDTTDVFGLKKFACLAKENGLAAFLPTLTGDTIEELKRKLYTIKEGMAGQKKDEAKIIGAHLEGTFLNKLKPGVQNPDNFFEIDTEFFKKNFAEFEDIIKIVVIAPETVCVSKRDEFIKYLKSKNIKVHFGHTKTDSIEGADGICHLFNAMDGIHHRKKSLVLSSLLSDIYTEVIGDTKHLSKDILKLIFKMKNEDKILMISDALPIAKSNLDEIEFCGCKILSSGCTKEGTLGGSVCLLPDILDNLVNLNIISKEKAHKIGYLNQINYLKLIV